MVSGYDLQNDRRAQQDVWATITLEKVVGLRMRLEEQRLVKAAPSSSAGPGVVGCGGGERALLWFMRKAGPKAPGMSQP